MEGLKERFKQLKISQKEVADFVGMSQPLVSMILSGVVKPNENTERKLNQLSRLCSEIDGCMKDKY